MADSNSVRPKEPVTNRDTGSAYDSATFKSSMTIRVEQNVGAMSISPSGRDVVLASRDGLHIIDLDNPYNPPRFLRHLSSWEVADVQWSPFAIRDYWVVSTSNQKALVWNLNRPSANAVETVLHGHSRAITDINFSAHNPDHLATCAVDSFVHIWDMKASRRPVLTFSDWFAGATQVKYNRQDENVIASSHDKLLHIWDKRKGAFPLQTIQAHDTKIYGIDWNRTRKTGIVTCSLDRAVKFWDYANDSEQPERILRTNYPVWRARHTPFGWGIMAMPQRGENDLFLYDRRATGDAYTEPVTKFSYHSAPVKEFLWRSRGGSNPERDDREFQLVTWSKDRDIRLWEIPLRLMKGIGHDPNTKLRFRLTRLGARYRTFRREPPAKSNDQHHLHSRNGALADAGQRIVPNIPLRLNAPSHRPTTSSSKLAPSTRQHGWNSKGFMSGQKSNLKSTTIHRDMNPIQWMKGVKMQHRGDGVFGLGGFSDDEVKEIEGIDAFTLSMKPNFKFGWTGPESLSDEITLVGLRFSKIKFERVNINNRTCLLSFSGPWGPLSQNVFLRCSIQFPPNYPNVGATPVFQIDKTTKMLDEKLDEIYSQLKKIADSYLSHQKFCLEACLSFLLGERAEDAMYWETKRGPGVPEDESSSDEDMGSALTRGPENGPAGLKQLVRKNNKGNVPLAKACGAMWSETGKLVCFFPPKEEHTQKSLISILNFSERLRDPYSERSSKHRFESFGRLQASTLRTANSVPPTGIDESTEDAEQSASSDLESSSISDDMLHSVARWAKSHDANSGVPRARNESTDKSTQVGNEPRSAQRSGGTSQLKSSNNKVDFTFAPSIGSRKRQRNYLTVHDYSHLLPSSRDLAEDYAIYGMGTEVCKHNASVATAWSHWDIRDSWRLAELILCKEIPLELSADPPGKDHMLVVSPQWRKSGSDLGVPNTPPSSKDEFFGRVKWGNHPCGGRWLVGKLISHFEEKLDPQMLAMLSCVFLEPEAKSSFTSASLHLSQQEMPISLKSPGFSLDYYPSFINALRRSDSFTLSPQHMSGTNTPLVTYPNSYSSSLGDNANNPWFNSASDPTTPYSMGNTPPMQPNPLIRGHTDLVGVHSMSSSPEHHHHHHHHSVINSQIKRSTGISNITGGIARALTAQGGLGAVISGGLNGMGVSPPTRRPKSTQLEQNTGITLASSQHPPTVSWAPEHQYRGKTRVLGWGIVTEEGEDSEEEFLIDLQLHHLEHFDDEGAMSIPLLDHLKHKSFHHYRETYADMLYTWDLPLQRLEILKFNGLKAFNDINLDRLENFSRKHDKNWDGLAVGGCCTQCGLTSTANKQTGSTCQHGDEEYEPEAISDDDITRCEIDLGDIPEYAENTLHPNTVGFLRDLARNNDREWFHKHKAAYQSALADFKSFGTVLQEEITKVDWTVPILPLEKHNLFRIYRDIRFSSSKVPYKEYFSVAFSRTGKQGLYAKYYLSVQPGNQSFIASKTFYAHFLDPGRETTSRMLSKTKGNEDQALKSFVERNSEDALKTAPKGYDKAHPDIALLRLKSYTVGKRITDIEILSPNCMDNIVDIIRELEPFVTYLNSVVMPDVGLGEGVTSGGEEDDD
ncbi:hypothetical protein H072_5615 [Dactylellina haptotyla CBS 200.50]|uniref:RWD domain-containing protein n=1 Tax=Dactylellina haptotyla (strain CBS 200.50) TaxID=1284197 RepID=S8AHA4_DACHA|nr:hypothetical protein H072_5615 [Dactylellina haptotyla CBS 200.50]